MKSASIPEPERLSPIRTYHRTENAATQTPEDAKRQAASLEIWGKPARNMLASDIPKVKAYVGPLPTNRRGIEFTTDIAPDPHTPPGQAFWSGPRPGIRLQGEYAILSVLAVVNKQPTKSPS